MAPRTGVMVVVDPGSGLLDLLGGFQAAGRLPE
jgi:hypothetical protein